ncbi:MAG: hypothetical protein GFH27_549319n114 [Chloroflexi bacterium AL-W]|nr:hypothetical protein [Chloroflexi bacterium AL-N1]NOK71277.1 hypothetical protein [Chloroflexi bacterium AL-N10]NOK77652.1 hypothetical protein [Chloroflexi bacterium AL-N5]NOK84503.1 hypothetical protein [Chloroflexi bacterium AL-W]NOK92954.1 hypothetical protein [Chloroflexi bacterium AL-N15]
MKIQNLQYLIQWCLWGRTTREESEWLEWFTAQQQALEARAEIEPPCVAYPEQEPWWGGWRQGYSEAWLHEVWFPFWKKLGLKERMAYVEKWQASPEWREYLIAPGYWSKPVPADQSNEEEDA